MHHPPGPSPSNSAASLKRHLSPDLAVAQGQSTQPKQSSGRPKKRTKQSPETLQSTRTMQSTTHSMPTSPGTQTKYTTAPNANERMNETRDKIQPGVLQPTMVPQPDLSPPPSPTLAGNFDLYGMYLPFLAKLYLPPGATTPDYSAVYDRILSSQAKHDYTARCFLAPQDPTSFTPPHGRFESMSVLDPVAERPFDINLDSFTYKKWLTFTPTETSSFPSPEHSVPGPGLVGRTALVPVCGIKSAKGVFKIKRVWVKKQDSSTKELFEGFFSFSVSYDSMYRKAGRGNGAKWKFAFWGVRAMKDNTGKEIGLGSKKIMW